MSGSMAIRLAALRIGRYVYIYIYIYIHARSTGEIIPQPYSK